MCAAVSRSPSKHRLWTVLVPFKGGSSAKSRLGLGGPLGPAFDEHSRRRLANAFFADTVAAISASPQVGNLIAIAPEFPVPTGPCVQRVQDPGRGLNAAIREGVRYARLHQPDQAIAIVTSDLPALTPEDFGFALALAERHPLTVVPDYQGSGTTMVTALPNAGLAPLFGPGSCRRHAWAGHVVLAVPQRSTLRRDVDTPKDLAAAVLEGVGHHTQSAMRGLPMGGVARLAQ
jgi:2-phospho-L-lactate guanylyltransferase